MTSNFCIERDRLNFSPLKKAPLATLAPSSAIPTAIERFLVPNARPVQAEPTNFLSILNDYGFYHSPRFLNLLQLARFVAQAPFANNLLLTSDGSSWEAAERACKCTIQSAWHAEKESNLTTLELSKLPWRR